MAMIVVKPSAPESSGVRPPLSERFCQAGLLVVRSGLTIVQLSPRSVDLWRNWLP